MKPLNSSTTQIRHIHIHQTLQADRPFSMCFTTRLPPRPRRCNPTCLYDLQEISETAMPSRPRSQLPSQPCCARIRSHMTYYSRSDLSGNNQVYIFIYQTQQRQGQQPDGANRQTIEGGRPHQPGRFHATRNGRIHPSSHVPKQTSYVRRENGHAAKFCAWLARGYNPGRLYASSFSQVYAWVSFDLRFTIFD